MHDNSSRLGPSKFNTELYCKNCLYLQKKEEIQTIRGKFNHTVLIKVKEINPKKIDK